MKSKTALIRGGIFLRSRRALWMRDQQHDALRISRRLREVIADTIRERTDVPRSGFEPKRYAAVVVEEAQIKTASGRIDGLDDAQQREVLDHVTSELKRQEGKVPPPGGAGQVRVRVAVTELQTPNRAVNAMTTLLVGPVTTGGASLEFEAVDLRTGRRVAAASCFERGNVIKEFAGSYTLLGHAKAAITNCIERIDSAWRDTQP